MTTTKAARARRIANDVIAYRTWAGEPSLAAIPSIAVISNPRIHQHERNRELRRGQNGVFDGVAVSGVARTLLAF